MIELKDADEIFALTLPQARLLIAQLQLELTQHELNWAGAGNPSEYPRYEYQRDLATYYLGAVEDRIQAEK